MKRILSSLSIRNKLMLSMLGISLAVSLVGFSYIIYYQQKTARMDLIESSRTQAALIGESVVVYLTFNDKEGAEEVLRKSANIRSINALALYDENNRLFCRTSKTGELPELTDSSFTAFHVLDKSRLRLNHPVRFRNRDYGTLVMSVFLHDLKKEKKEYLNLIFILSIILFLLAYTLAYPIQKMFTRPLLRLVESTRKIREQDYDQPVSYSGKDEFLVLVEGFNLMMKTIREREEKLAEDANFIDRIIDNSAVSTWIADKDGTAVRANQASLDFFGTTADSVIGKYNIFKDELLYKSNDIDEIRKVFEKGEVKKLVIEYNLQKSGHVKAENATDRIINSVFTPISDQQGRVVNVIVQTIDLTQLKTTERELRQLKDNLEVEVQKRTAELKEQVEKLDTSQKAMLYMVEDLNEVTAQLKKEQEKLEASNQELQAFTYSVSHDLRAPLRAINGYASFLWEDYQDNLDAEGQRFIETIRKNANRMDELITHLLDLSRVSRAEMSYSEVNMKDRVWKIYHELSSDEEKREFEFVLEDLPSVRCDRNLVTYIWQNLISNALKYSSKSDKKRIEVFSEKTKDAILYGIKDYGVGFNMKYEDKLFGIFQRLHKETEYEGTGVGLAIVHRLVRRHGGKIFAEGEINKGAKFCFTLPIK